MRETRREPAGFRQRIVLRERVPVGAQVLRNADAVLIAKSRASYESVTSAAPTETLSVRLFGTAGSPLKAVFTRAGGDADTITVRSTATLQPADRHALDERTLRAQLGRLGDTPFTLGEIDCRALKWRPVLACERAQPPPAGGSFGALREPGDRWAMYNMRIAGRALRLPSPTSQEESAPPLRGSPPDPSSWPRACIPWMMRALPRLPARPEIILDPFLRHPAPPAARVRALAAELAVEMSTLWLRLPTIVRPPEHRTLAKWLDLGLPVVTGHLGLARSLAREGRRVTADYAVNCFNPHTAAAVLATGVERLVLSVELTAGEIADACAVQGARVSRHSCMGDRRA